MTFTLHPKHRLAASLLMLASAAGAACGQNRIKAAKATAMDAPGVTAARAAMALQSVGANETLHIVVGQSMMLRGVSPMRRIYIGNPAILQTFTSGPEEVVVTAKAPGISSLVIWDTQGRSCLYTISADIDPSGLRSSLNQAYPASHINVQATEDRIDLTGTVPSPETFDGAAKLAAVYSKEVANSLRIVPIRGKQVQLKLRILEVDRTKLEQFGVNLSYGGKIITAGSTTQQFSSPLNLSFYNARTGLGVQVQDLEQKQIVQILAEPTLTAMSGHSASFLSGGEFPFPIVEGGVGNSTAISIEFRSYGIKVDFTPTVNADDTIHLKVAPEVSTLDYTNSVTISGFTIPALSTRRAETEVELKDGQSFVLSGLLDHRTTEILAQVPGIANVPILGQLFRSKNNTHSVVELVVMVEVHVIDPINNPGHAREPNWPLQNLNSDKFDEEATGKK